MGSEFTSFDEQMAIGRLHSKRPSYFKALKFSMEGISCMLDSAPNSYVSISFGKQSLCVAHMVYQLKPDIPMHFLASEETWMLYDYEKVIEEFCSKWPINLTIHQTKRLEGANTWKESRDSGDQDLQNMCDRSEWDGWFWGLAKDESKERRRTLMKGYYQDTAHPSIFRYTDGKLRCCPVMNWTLNDLAAYISTHGIPLLNIYKKHGLSQRTTARITKKMLLNQGMGLDRRLNPMGYRKLVDKFPEINIQ